MAATEEIVADVCEAEPQGGLGEAGVAGRAVPCEAGEVPFADVLESRAAFYEMLAALFFMPLGQEQVNEMAQKDFLAYAGLNERFDQGINDIMRYLRKRNTGTRQELACDFTSAFAGTKTYEGKSAVPYESVFTSEDGLLCQESYHEVYRAFKRESLRKEDGLNFPEDHLSYLCQFMAVMSRRAAAKLSRDDLHGALDDLKVSRDFLERHICSWYPRFEQRALFILKTRFYRGVLAMGAGFFSFDEEVLDDLIQEIAACID